MEPYKLTGTAKSQNLAHQETLHRIFLIKAKIPLVKIQVNLGQF